MIQFCLIAPNVVIIIRQQRYKPDQSIHHEITVHSECHVSMADSDQQVLMLSQIEFKLDVDDTDWSIVSQLTEDKEVVSRGDRNAILLWVPSSV